MEEPGILNGKTGVDNGIPAVFQMHMWRVQQAIAANMSTPTDHCNQLDRVFLDI